MRRQRKKRRKKEVEALINILVLCVCSVTRRLKKNFAKFLGKVAKKVARNKIRKIPPKKVA
jgi:hypothetical protein